MEWHHVFNRTSLWNRFRSVKNKSRCNKQMVLLKLVVKKYLLHREIMILTENIIHLVLARSTDSPAGTKGISLFL